ncbi:MAG TPA: sigma-70 family RNA polymerase sigma factor [Candidatus Polarisedimenticolia bacterium]|nr:sigma-70 family RNA polymerase sigma factor [Candidatus Polarisedimenticolia bacterium]
MEGDEEAFAGLVARFHTRLVRFARSFLSDAASAEEVVQDTWMAVLRGLPSFEGRSSLGTWIYQILANRAKSRAVRDGRMLLLADLEIRDNDPAVDPSRFTARGGWADPPRQWEADDPEALLLRSEMGRIIAEALARLPAAQRAVVTLRDVEGFSSAEVCNILDLTETNQRVLLHRARSSLRRELERHIDGR